MTEREVADIFGVTPRTVRRWAFAGELPAVRVGGITRYRAVDVDTILAPSKSETRTANPGLAKLAGDGDGHGED